MEFSSEMQGLLIKSTTDNGSLVALSGGSGSTVPYGTGFYLTGFYKEYGTGFAYQTTSNPNMGIYIADVDNSGWQTISSKSYTVGEANNILSKLFANQKNIYANNLLCARFADRFSTEDKKLLYALQYRLIERNDELKNSNGILKDESESYPAGYIAYAEYLNSFMEKYNKNGGVGIVATLSLTSIIVTAIITASLATAAYLIYKNLYSESAQDVKLSEELTQRLKSKYNITDEDLDAIVQEMKGAVSKAELKTKISSYAGFGKTLLYITLGGLAFFALQKYVFVESAGGNGKKYTRTTKKETI